MIGTRGFGRRATGLVLLILALFFGLSAAATAQGMSGDVWTDGGGSGYGSGQGMMSGGVGGMQPMMQMMGGQQPAGTMPMMENDNDASEHPCLQAGNHEYEVCTAYVANSSVAVLVPYYKYVHSTNQSTARYVTYRLGSRYQGDAYDTMTGRTSGWPSGTNKVASPTIEIESVESDLSTNSATLQTREWWRVTAANGRVLYQEDGDEHTVTMARVPSYVLHKWVVASIQ